MFKTIIKYVKIYLILVRYAIQSDLAYWGNFVTSIIVELFYQGAFLVFFAVVMSKTKAISGWGPYELLILLGIDTFTSEFITGMVIVWNTRELPRKIWSGELDNILLRPINPLFYITLGKPYFPSFISSLAGFVLIGMGVSGMGINLTIIGLAGSILFFIFGFVIIYSLIVIFSLMTFFFQDTITLPRIGERIVYSFTSRPHDIFGGLSKIIFYFILPVVYVSSFSAMALIRGVDWAYLIVAFGLAFSSITIVRLIWNMAIKNYASASS